MVSHDTRELTYSDVSKYRYLVPYSPIIPHLTAMVVCFMFARSISLLQTLLISPRRINIGFHNSPAFQLIYGSLCPWL